MFIDGKRLAAPAGSFVYIPAGAVHGFCVGARPSKKLNLYVPQKRWAIAPRVASSAVSEAIAAAVSSNSPTIATGTTGH